MVSGPKSNKAETRILPRKGKDGSPWRQAGPGKRTARCQDKTDVQLACCFPGGSDYSGRGLWSGKTLARTPHTRGTG